MTDRRSWLCRYVKCAGRESRIPRRIQATRLAKNGTTTARGATPARRSTFSNDRLGGRDVYHTGPRGRRSAARDAEDDRARSVRPQARSPADDTRNESGGNTGSKDAHSPVAVPRLLPTVRVQAAVPLRPLRPLRATHQGGTPRWLNPPPKNSRQRK